MQIQTEEIAKLKLLIDELNNKIKKLKKLKTIDEPYEMVANDRNKKTLQENITVYTQTSNEDKTDK